MPINWLGSRADLNLDRVNSPSIAAMSPLPVDDPEAATPAGVAACTDINAKRRVWINMPMQPPYIDEATGHPAVWYKGNQIRTSKYTLISFLPKNLFEQFRSVANFYFTSLVILQAFPPFQQVSIVVTAAPIVIIIFVTAIKDAFEDMKRHKSDDEVNNTYTYLLSDWTNTNHPAVAPGGNAFKKFADNVSAFFLQYTSLLTTLLMDFLIPGRHKKKKAKAVPPDHLSPDDYLRSDDASIIPPQTPSSNNMNPQTPHPPPPTTPSKVSMTPAPIWKRSKWEDVRVGDFVFLRGDDPIPADLVVISTSENDSVCYVETKNLDGETNLKVRNGVRELSFVRTPGDCRRIRAVMDSEPPNVNLYAFTGVLSVFGGGGGVGGAVAGAGAGGGGVEQPTTTSRKNTIRNSWHGNASPPPISTTSSSSALPPPPTTPLTPSLSTKTRSRPQSWFGNLPSPLKRRTSSVMTKDEGGPKVVIPVGISGVLLRGCVLRNTKWVIGVAVYTGDDTKIMLNSGATPSKRSKIDRGLNPMVLVSFLLLLVMCLVCAIIAAIYAATYIHTGAPFSGWLSDVESPVYTAFVTFFSSMIVFQTIIPIALYISIDVAKTFQ
ncbi:hypothetical protein HDV00_011203, partial [Rhizophlyctis rosea]